MRVAARVALCTALCAALYDAVCSVVCVAVCCSVCSYTQGQRKQMFPARTLLDVAACVAASSVFGSMLRIHR